MKIATYNLWNSPGGHPARQDALCRELARVDADIVALQEVSAASEQAYDGYPYTAFVRYVDDPSEGLGCLSKFPLLGVEAGWEFSPALDNCGLRVTLCVSDVRVAVTNVHLDYKSIATREAQILAVTEWTSARAGMDCLEVLCGDFNCCPESSVYQFLRGQQTLAGKESPVWHDLAASYASRFGRALPPTLDFRTNPRWAGQASLELPARFDWLLVQERWPLPMPSLTNVALIGRHPAPGSTLIPSDHYGLLAELEFS